MRDHSCLHGILVLLLLTGLVTATYGYILHLGFTAPDTLPLIRDGRIDGLSDLLRILNRGILGGEYYRPVAQLSYGVDYALSGLQPAGYHLTDALFHLAGVLELALLARRWGVPGGWLGAFLCAALFAVHPILAENVPAIARRHDVLATTFGLFALLCLDKARGRLHSLPGVLSLIALLLALGSKEIAFLLVPVGLLDLASRHRLPREPKIALGWVGAASLFYLWRQSRGAIGVHPWAIFRNPGKIEKIGRIYLVGLSGLYNTPQGETVITTAVALVGIGMLLIVAWWVLRPDATRLGLIAVGWTVGGGLFLVLTNRADPRNLYLPAVGFSLLLGGTLVGGAFKLRRQPGLATVALSLMVILTTVGVLYPSPLRRPYPGWITAGELTTRILSTVEDTARLLPQGSTLYLVNLPHVVLSPSDRPGERSVAVLRKSSVISWLTLRGLDTFTTVEVCSDRVVVPGTSSPLLVYLYGNAATVVVASKPEEPSLPWDLFWNEVCDAQLPSNKNALRSNVHPDTTLVGTRLGESISLVGVRLPRTAFHAGETLPLVLYWRTSRPVTLTYTVFVHLMDSDGRLWAQHDAPPVNGTYPTSLWPANVFVADGHALLLDPTMPPGEYGLWVGMYRLETMERLPAWSSDGQRLEGDAAFIGWINVENSAY